MAKSQNIIAKGKDDIAGELKTMFDDSRETTRPTTDGQILVDRNMIMQKLVSYIVRRDHTIHSYAYQLGRLKEHEATAKEKK